MRRAICIEHVLGLSSADKTLELSRASEIKIEKKLLHLDSLNDGSYRITWSTSFISDLSKVERFTISMATGVFYIVGIQEEVDGRIVQSISRENYKVNLIPIKSDNPMLHLEEDARGNWRLLYSKELLDRTSANIDLIIIRE